MRQKHYITIVLFFIYQLVLGQIGVNTDTPTKILDVQGDARIRVLPLVSSAGTYRLTLADANGNFSYADFNLPVANSGDIKTSFRTADHNGWYILNGRSLTSLSTTARTAANALGISGSLPDSRGKFLKSRKNSSEILGSSGGSNIVELKQENLPNYNFSGITSSEGTEHTHNWNDSSHSAGNAFQYRPNAGTNFHVRSANNSVTTSSSGAHTHSVTIKSGGSSLPFSVIPTNISVNTFIYLGQ